MITLLGQPKSTNHIYKSRCFNNHPSVYLSAEGKAIKEDYIKQLKKQWKREPLEGNVRLAVVFFHGDKRKRDLDNYNKLWIDSCNGILFNDDNQIVELYMRKEIDKSNPRIIIEVLE